MLRVYIPTLQEEVEVSEEGKFVLPSKEYTPAESYEICVICK